MTDLVICPENLMQQLNETEKELAECHSAASNAMYRIGVIKETVRFLLKEHGVKE